MIMFIGSSETAVVSASRVQSTDKKEYEFNLCYPFGIEGIIDYELYFYDTIALSATIKGWMESYR